MPILLAILIAFFNQLSGINAILYFAPRIFELTGLGAKAALLQSVGIGVTNLIFTFVGLWLIDRLGRRTLLFIGSFGYIFSLGLIAWAFFTEHFSIVPRVHLRFHRGACRRPGRGDLGVHLGNFPQPPSGGRPGAGQLHALDLCRAADHVLSRGWFPRLPPGYVFLVLLRHDGAATGLGETMVPETKGVPLEQIQRQLGIDLATVRSQRAP